MPSNDGHSRRETKSTLFFYDDAKNLTFNIKKHWAQPSKRTRRWNLQEHDEIIMTIKEEKSSLFDREKLTRHKTRTKILLFPSHSLTLFFRYFILYIFAASPLKQWKWIFFSSAVFSEQANEIKIKSFAFLTFAFSFCSLQHFTFLFLFSHLLIFLTAAKWQNAVQQ